MLASMLMPQICPGSAGCCWVDFGALVLSCMRPVAWRMHVLDHVDASACRDRRYNSTPRVLHLSTFDAHDGAARGSAWLNKALCLRGIESTIVVGRKRSDDPAFLP